MTRIINPIIYSRSEISHLDSKYVPERVAIIMDGNRRWAEKNGFSKEQGHRAGAEVLANIARPAADLGIKVLTVYGFSTENWLRQSAEVQTLLDIIQEHLLKEEIAAIENGVKLDFLGDLDAFPDALRSLCQEARKITTGHENFKLVLALNYGGRDELIRAFKAILAKVKQGELKKEEISSSLITSYTQDHILGGQLDLIIRTSGEKRVSNFLLWHLPGSQYLELPVYWPDFNKNSLLEAVGEYQRRKMKY